jgi:hypothetical protein
MVQFGKNPLFVRDDSNYSVVISSKARNLFDPPWQDSYETEPLLMTLGSSVWR